MLDYLRWLNAFDPEKDLGEAILAASGEVRCYEEGLTFSRGGTSIFAQEEIHQADRPVVDLPVDIRQVTVKVYDADGNPIGHKKQIRILKQSDVGEAVGMPPISYHQAKTPGDRALIRALETSFNTYKPRACPWQGAIAGFWHAANRVLGDQPNEKLILEAGTAVLGLTRAASDPSNSLVHSLTNHISHSKNPTRALKAIVRWATRIVKGAGNDQELVEREAKSCMEEALEASDMTVEQVRREGALFMQDGRIISRGGVVAHSHIYGEGGEHIHFGYTEDGEKGELLSYDNLIDREEERAEEKIEEKTAERLALGSKQLRTYPVLLDSDVHRPMRSVESMETKFLFAFKAVNLRTNKSRNLLVEGSEDRAKWLKNRLDASGRFAGTKPVQIMHPTWAIGITQQIADDEVDVQWARVEGPENMAAFLTHCVSIGKLRTPDEVEMYREDDFPKNRKSLTNSTFRGTCLMIAPTSGVPVKIYKSFGGTWVKGKDDKWRKAVGAVRQTLPLDIEGNVDSLGILRDAPEGSGFSKDDVGCYVEQVGDCTLILRADWMTENVDMGGTPAFHELLSTILKMERHDTKQEQVLRAMIWQQGGDFSKQRFLRGILRMKTRELMTREAMTDRLAELLHPFMNCGMETFHMLRASVGKKLKSVMPTERKLGWAFINALRDELRADAIRSLDTLRKDINNKPMLNSFASTRKSIRARDFSTFDGLNKRVNEGSLEQPAWMTFLLKEELFDARTSLKEAALLTLKRDFWKRDAIKKLTERGRASVICAARLVGDDDLLRSAISK